MKEGIYCLAGLLIGIRSQYDEVHRMCRDYMAEGQPAFWVSTTQADIEEENRQSDEERQLEGLPPYTYPDPYLETLSVYRKIAEAAIPYGRLLMHGSVIAVDGRAYMFTAKSGTGKSTHVRLWRQLFGSRAVMVNDDKPLLRVTPEEVTVYGTPWDGKHHLSNNIAVPLQAVCILTRDTTNHIREIRPAEAVEMLLQQTYRPEGTEALLGMLDLLNLLTKHVRFYLLGCNMDPEAARVSALGMEVKV